MKKQEAVEAIRLVARISSQCAIDSAKKGDHDCMMAHFNEMCGALMCLNTLNGKPLTDYAEANRQLRFMNALIDICNKAQREKEDQRKIAAILRATY